MSRACAIDGQKAHLAPDEIFVSAFHHTTHVRPRTLCSRSVRGFTRANFECQQSRRVKNATSPVRRGRSLQLIGRCTSVINAFRPMQRAINSGEAVLQWDIWRRCGTPSGALAMHACKPCAELGRDRLVSAMCSANSAFVERAAIGRPPQPYRELESFNTGHEKRVVGPQCWNQSRIRRLTLLFQT